MSYLNAEPLVYGLGAQARFRLERDTPARVAERLHRGEIDLGLIPSIEYAAGDYAIVPDVAIASRGPVRSVCLFHGGRLEAVRRVALDTSSRTSVALLKVLLRERLGRDPEYVPMAPDVPAMLSAADAALVIGDVALYFEAGGLERLDLGSEWTALTGQPFVYAFWAGRPGAIAPADVASLRGAMRAGLDAVPRIAAAYDAPGCPAGRVGRRETNEAYLRSHVVYAFGAAERSGLREFYRRVHALGLIARIPELRFYDGP